jgi:hypothetical protein
MTDEVACKEELTLDELIHAMQNAWSHFRNAQLYAFWAAAPVLTWARENEADFRTYCKRNTVRGQELETLVVELMLGADGDGEAILRERRAEYAACIGWFADRDLCPDTDPNKAVMLAQEKGRITGIAQAYREKKDAANPTAKAAKQKAQATKARRVNKASRPDVAVPKDPRSVAAEGTGSAESISDDAPDRSDDAADEPVFLTRRIQGGPHDELIEEIIATGKRVELPRELDHLPGVALWLTVRKGAEAYAFGPIYDYRLIRAASTHLPVQRAA